MLFTAGARPGLESGAITVTFRSWKRPQVKAGGCYRVGGRHERGGVWLAVDRVLQVPVAAITDADARRAGFADRAGLVGMLKGRNPEPASDTPVWRVDFHRVDPPAEPSLADRSDLTRDEVDEIARRLDRLDAAADHGRWTRRALWLISERPATVSTVLAAEMGRERMAFKEDVRKLKRLGLTESLEVGYRLSARGRAFLEAIGR
jgi:hypothetical protein